MQVWLCGSARRAEDVSCLAAIVRPAFRYGVEGCRPRRLKHTILPRGKVALRSFQVWQTGSARRVDDASCLAASLPCADYDSGVQGWGSRLAARKSRTLRNSVRPRELSGRSLRMRPPSESSVVPSGVGCRLPQLGNLCESAAGGVGLCLKVPLSNYLRKARCRQCSPPLRRSVLTSPRFGSTLANEKGVVAVSPTALPRTLAAHICGWTSRRQVHSEARSPAPSPGRAESPTPNLSRARHSRLRPAGLRQAHQCSFAATWAASQHAPALSILR